MVSRRSGLGVHVLGIGTAVPAQTILQTDAAMHALSLSSPTDEGARLLPAVYRRSGVKTRGSVLLEPGPEISIPFFSPGEGPSTGERMEAYRAKAPALAIEAAGNALKKAGIKAECVRHLITITCTGFFAPGFDIELIEQLGLPTDIHRTQIGFMGCHAAINGLRVAQAIAKSHPNEPILICSVELSSLHYAYDWRPDHIVANSLFADGAGAMVLRGERGKGLNLIQTAAKIIPDSKDKMSWQIGDQGFEMSLSAEVPRLIQAHLRGWLEEVLAKEKRSLKDIGSWAVHPGGPKILDAVEEALGLSHDALSVSRDVLANYGNMSSATIFFILEKLKCANSPRPYLALAFGPGLSAESALFS